MSEFIRHQKRYKAFWKSYPQKQKFPTPQNLPSLIAFPNPAKDRGDLPKIPGASSKIFGQVNIFTKPSKHQLLNLLLWLIYLSFYSSH